MMSKIEILFRSPAFYTILAVAVYHFLEGLAPSLGGNLGLLVQSLLIGMSFYFHSQGIQIAGMTGRLGGATIRK